MSPSSNLPEPLQVLKLHLPHLGLQLSSVTPCLEQGNTTIPEMYGWGTNSCSPAQQGHTATRGGGGGGVTAAVHSPSGLVTASQGARAGRQAGTITLHSQSLTLCSQCSFKGWPQSCKHKARTCENNKEMSELGCTSQLSPLRAQSP